MDDLPPPSYNFKPIEVDEPLGAQLHDSFCNEVRLKLNRGVYGFKIDDNGLLVRASDTAVQIVASHSLKQRILYINHYYLFSGHPERRKMYYKIRKDF